jgi:hypothetical protein
MKKAFTYTIHKLFPQLVVPKILRNNILNFVLDTDEYYNLNIQQFCLRYMMTYV